MCRGEQGKQHHDRFLEDEVVRAYFDNLKSRAKNTGKDLDGKQTTHLSKETQSNVKLALRHIIEKLGLEDSEHVISDLVHQIETNIEAKRTLERKLSAIANEQPLTSARMHMIFWKGVFHRGAGITLNVNCDNHFTAEHKAIDPLTLRDIRNKVTKDQGLDLDLLVFTGERPDEMYSHRITQFRKLNEHYYALDSIKFQNKGGLAHYCIMPARIAEQAIKRAQDNGWTTIKPNWRDTWRNITPAVTVAFGVHLTAKYLRKRFKTIAHDANMPSNHYNFLEGSKPTEGANAAFYELGDEAKFLREYDLLLSEALDLTHIGAPTTKRRPTGYEDSREINRKLDLILAKLGIENAPATTKSVAATKSMTPNR